jgi:P-type Ca2+ transporter type 2C
MKQRRLRRLLTLCSDRYAKVVRSGKSIEIPAEDILVGDIVQISAGDIVPADGILIDGYLKCDESMYTGESDLVSKVPGDEVFSILELVASNSAMVNAGLLRKMDPFIQSRAEVYEGYGSFLATSVGVNSLFGQMSMALGNASQSRGPQTQKLHSLSLYGFRIGIAVALIFALAAAVIFISTLPSSTLTAEEKGRSFFASVVMSIAVVVVAAPLYLNLAGSTAMLIAINRMRRDNILVSRNRAIEVVGNVTAICTSKTGILTQGKMRIAAATLGKSISFNDRDLFSDGTSVSGMLGSRVVAVDGAHGFVQKLASETKCLLIQSIALNSTAFESVVDGEKTFVGSKCEVALMLFSRDLLGLGYLSEERHNADFVMQIPFSHQEKFMATVVRLPNGLFRIYVKGAAEIVLGKCTKTIENEVGVITSLVDLVAEDHQQLQQTIALYGQQGLHPITLAYYDLPYCPSLGKVADGNLILIAIFGMQAPIREGVPERIEHCLKAGIGVRLVTGDNIETARTIARDIGLYGPDSTGIVLEGPAFRCMSREEQLTVVPKLVILARASPRDKIELVETLNSIGEVVAVTDGGVGAHGALRRAHAGFAYGISGTEGARNAADFILMDDNFISLTKCIAHGRTLTTSIQKYLQVSILRCNRPLVAPGL